MLKVSAKELRNSAVRMRELRDEITDEHQVPYLTAQRGALGLPGSAIGAALSSGDDASTQAKSVLASRLDVFAQLLDTSADLFVDSDRDAAARIAAIPDLNDAV